MDKLPLGERPEPRTVGRGSMEAKEKARRDILERFGEGHLAQFTESQLEEFKLEEREKTDEEKESIRVANEVTNDLLGELGLLEFDVPLANVHFVSRRLWYKTLREGSDTLMLTSPNQQAIFANGGYEPRAYTRVALGIFHEFIHLRGHLSVDVDSETSKNLFRSGLVTHPTYKKTEKVGRARWFDGLNEAVVTEIEKKQAESVLRRNRFLLDEVAWLDSPEAMNLKEKYAEDKRVDSSEIKWISRDGKEICFYGYRKQRMVFDYVVDQVYENGGFKSRDDVVRVFFEAHFKNSLLPIGRLVEKTFGKGSFEFLGTMDREKDSLSAGRVLNFLMKRRRFIMGTSREREDENKNQEI